jgi:histidinol dehydrogenase
MNIYKNPKPESWTQILQRPVFESKNLFESVQKILDDVKQDGDKAVKKYTRKFDKIDLEDLSCTSEEIAAAKLDVKPELQKAIKEAKKNLERFHGKQLCKTAAVETTPGVKCWQRIVPIEKVGLYIPGGTAPLLSTALMLGVPAKLAGCTEIILTSPPGPDGKISPAILYIAHLLGIEKVYKIGGAQAIAAMAYGTDSVPSVNKIFGPGNQYVTAAKQLVGLDTVAIDLPAGPSELAIIADDSAKPAYIASDLLSQAEHGVDSQVVMVSDSEILLKAVQEEVEKQLEALPRKEIAKKALLNSKMILMDEKSDMLKMINEYAPEHLILACKDYARMARKIINAGSVFLGNYTPESAGDYASGTNHTLPTNGWSKSYSGLNMDDFVKKISFQEITKYGIFNISNSVMEMAEAEELEAHKNAVKIRL